MIGYKGKRYDMGEMGIMIQISPSVRCVFCPGEFVVTAEDDGKETPAALMHSSPWCTQFDVMNVDQFLVNSRQVRESKRNKA